MNAIEPRTNPTTTQENVHPLTITVMDVSMRQRWDLMGQEGCVVWLTGLSASGKSTVARELDLRLLQLEKNTFVLDGDNLRQGLCSGLGFSDADRDENVRRAGEVALLMAEAGLMVLCAFISPFRRQRANLRARCEAAGVRFFEVYVNAPLHVCEKRDPKGLYSQARSGALQAFTGVGSAYEPPASPDLELCTDSSDIKSCVDALLRLLTGAA